MGSEDSINYAFYHALYKSATGITNGYVGAKVITLLVDSIFFTQR